MQNNYYVYILTNPSHGSLYIGFTSNLAHRIEQHRSRSVPGFTSKYNLQDLLYFEETSDVHAALAREKQLKGWRRSKKEWLVNQMNPDWEDLSVDAAGVTDPSTSARSRLRSG
jgi:putative endonuclease